MKYLSGKPFTGGANSKAFVENWDAVFGEGNSSPGSGASFRPCGIVVNGSPCALPIGHVADHYTEADKAEFARKTIAREREARLFQAGASFPDDPCPPEDFEEILKP